MRGLGKPLREALLLVALSAVVVVGSVTAAVRQVPPRSPLDPLAWVLMAATIALLAARRRRPFWVLLGTVLLSGAYLRLDYPYGPTFLAVAVAAYALALRTGVRTAVLGLVASVVVLVGFEVSWSRLGDLVVLLPVWTAWLGVPAWVAATVRLRRAARADQDERRRQDARAQREEAERLVVEERLAVSREVHDIVAHSLSLISLQSGVALHLLDSSPEQTRTALTTIRRASADALTDLRRVLETLRRSSGGAADRFRLDCLPELVDHVRHEGLAVSLAVVGVRQPVPAEVETCAYRVVQESLTNVIKHSGTSSASVRLIYDNTSLVVEVADAGPGAPSSTGTGRGIAGMRERVLAVGGRLTAERVLPAGFRVRAWLPVPADRS